MLLQQAGDLTNDILDHTTIVANYIKWDDEGNMEGIKGDILHSSNKGSFAAALDYKDSVKVVYIFGFTVLLFHTFTLASVFNLTFRHLTVSHLKVVTNLIVRILNSMCHI